MKSITIDELKRRFDACRNPRCAIIGGVVLLLIVVLLSGVVPWNKLHILSDPNMIDGRNAYDIALLRAKEWQSDVLMDRISSGDIGDTGKSKVWKVVFVSKALPDKGFLVEVVDRSVVSAYEIPYSGVGADFPVETISQDEAIRRMRSVPGYENEPVISVEAVYGPAGEVWYWGVRTAKGVVSIQAK